MKYPYALELTISHCSQAGMTDVGSNSFCAALAVSWADICPDNVLSNMLGNDPYRCICNHNQIIRNQRIRSH